MTEPTRRHLLRLAAASALAAPLASAGAAASTIAGREAIPGEADPYGEEFFDRFGADGRGRSEWEARFAPARACRDQPVRLWSLHDQVDSSVDPMPYHSVWISGFRGASLRDWLEGDGVSRRQTFGPYGDETAAMSAVARIVAAANAIAPAAGPEVLIDWLEGGLGGATRSLTRGLTALGRPALVVALGCARGMDVRGRQAVAGLSPLPVLVSMRSLRDADPSLPCEADDDDLEREVLRRAVAALATPGVVEAIAAATTAWVDCGATVSAGPALAMAGLSKPAPLAWAIGTASLPAATAVDAGGRAADQADGWVELAAGLRRQRALVSAQIGPLAEGVAPIVVALTRPDEQPYRVLNFAALPWGTLPPRVIDAIYPSVGPLRADPTGRSASFDLVIFWPFVPVASSKGMTIDS